MITESVIVSSRGYIILPAHIRKEMNIKSGTKILLSREDNKIILHPVSSFTGKLSGLTAGSFGEDADHVKEYIDKERKDRINRMDRISACLPDGCRTGNKSSSAARGKIYRFMSNMGIKSLILLLCSWT